MTTFIADDFASIKARMRELADEARRRDDFVLPDSMVILLSSAMANTRLSHDIEAAFMLHISSVSANVPHGPKIDASLLLIQGVGPPRKNTMTMLEHLQRYYPTAYRYSDQEIALSYEDAVQLLRRLRVLLGGLS